MTIKDGGVYYPLGCSEGMSEGEYQAQFDYGDGPPVAFEEDASNWRTRNGSVLKIAKMTTGHLKNAISYFERTGWGDEPKIRELRKELSRRTP